MHQLSLVFCTFLAQTAIGIVVFSTFAFLSGKLERGRHEKALNAALATLAVAGIACFAHLENPLLVINRLAALDQSPISHEILATVLFSLLLIITLVCLKYRQGSNTVKAVSLFTAFAGVVLLHTIPTLFIVGSATSPQSLYTTFYMVLTALLMGSTVIFFLNDCRLLKYIAMISLLVGIILVPSYFAYLGLSNPNFLPQTALFWMIKLAFAGLAIISLSSEKRGNTQFSSLAVLFVAASEIAGRIGLLGM